MLNNIPIKQKMKNLVNKLSLSNKVYQLQADKNKWGLKGKCWNLKGSDTSEYCAHTNIADDLDDVANRTNCRKTCALRNLLNYKDASIMKEKEHTV